MTWRNSARLGGVALAIISVGALSRPLAAQQDIERILAGIRLGSNSKTVLARYGNPNEVVIGDVGIRSVGAGGQGASTPGVTGGDSGGLPSGFQGAGGPPAGLPAPSNAPPPVFNKPSSGLSPGAQSLGGGGAPGGPPPGFSGPPSGFSGSRPGGGPPAGFGGPPAGFGAPTGAAPGDEGGGAPGAGGGVGGFGQTYSTLARQQEVTWIYNRKINNNLVSYEFLIGPGGSVAQIRSTGYKGGNIRTSKGVVLGSTYKDVVKTYGYPEEHAVYGNILIASYRKTAHIQFQFMNRIGQADPMSSGNKVIGITIAQVE